MGEDYYAETETRFNSGITIAQEISYYVVKSGMYCFSGQYLNWYRMLKIIENRMYPRIFKKKEALEELNNIKKKYYNILNEYQKRVSTKRNINVELNNNMELFLNEYERSLLIWRDKFGYGMPETEDAVSMAWK